MLMKMLRSALRRGPGKRCDAGNVQQAGRPAAARDALHHLLKDALAVRHLEVLFDGASIAGEDFLALYVEALGESHTGVPPAKWYRRAQRAYHLARYFEHALHIEGARAECGVFAGFSALLLCKTAAAHLPGYAGGDFHLFDSFEGLSEVRGEDLVADPAGGPGSSPYRKGDMSVPRDFVNGVFRAYPELSIHQGWIPEVFSGLAERRWSFVHIDVDLYDPTLASLEYFFPRLTKGGVIVNDDYASPDFPGGGSAWERFCTDNRVPFVVLDTGQAVIIA